MTQIYSINKGFASKLGATITDSGVNFAVYSQHADQLYLCLYDGDTEVARLAFCHRTHHIWHMEIVGLSTGQAYGYRADGPFIPEQQQLFNVHKLLMDPYARHFTSKLVCHPDQAAMYMDGRPNNTDSAYCVPKSVVCGPATAPRTLSVPIQSSERVIYELHIKGFSQQLDIDPILKGKYLGVSSAAGLAHLQALGITTIQLMPCFSFASENRLLELGLSNYWGYNPISFFAPEPSYALNDAIAEFKTMIDTLHDAGFEVILDVVYNHTAESELHQSSVCYRGLDNAVYYRHAKGQYLNFTGCGNCVDTFKPAGLRLIMDSMRYWVEQMGVDGFRFDLGVDLGRQQHDFSMHAPLLQAIQQDPLLNQCCLIIEPWDIGPDGYQVGHFPDGFLECNDKYRDTVRRFWRGDEGQTQALATRLMGSRDVFHKGYKNALSSVNYVTYHDGYTLRDLVSYHRRHNQANMENNRDGHGDNISQNFGVEGFTTDEKIRRNRLNQQECLLATLLLSQGTPHILGGDELNHSQQGNNNAYCQDNPITWLNWKTSNERSRLSQCIQQLIRLRKQFPILAEVYLPDDDLYQHLQADQVEWINEYGDLMSIEDWNEHERDYLGLVLKRPSSGSHLWIGFYRDDTPCFVKAPTNSVNLTPLYQTQGVNIEQLSVECLYRSVFIMQIHV